MTIDIRPPTGDELRDCHRTVCAALLFQPLDDEGWERSRPSWEEMVSVAAWEGDRCVGHVGYFEFGTTVPGGVRLRSGGVSRVGVLPTHRRRGLATQLMHRLIQTAGESGLALLSLRASEAVIYERYGFGVAGELVEAEIDAAGARPVRGASTDGSMHLLEADEILDVVPGIYERHAHNRPGVIERPRSFWDRYFRDAITQSKPSFVVVHRAASGELDGFTHYDVKWNEEPGERGGIGEVHDLVGATPAIELALWSYLFDIDLIRRWKAEERPVDDHARNAVADRRAYAIKSVDDEQWVRLIDVGEALAGRTYNAALGTLTIGVTDALIPGNNATWEVSRAGARLAGSGAAQPDVTVDIATLSALYMGGTTWHAMHARGSVTATSDEVVALADALFASRPLPYCGSFF